MPTAGYGPIQMVSLNTSPHWLSGDLPIGSRLRLVHSAQGRGIRGLVLMRAMFRPTRCMAYADKQHYVNLSSPCSSDESPNPPPTRPWHRGRPHLGKRCGLTWWFRLIQSDTPSARDGHEGPMAPAAIRGGLPSVGAGLG